MTAVQPPLFPPGWEQEPDAEPVQEPQGSGVFGDHGTGVSRRRRLTDWDRPVNDVATGRWL